MIIREDGTYTDPALQERLSPATAHSSVIASTQPIIPPLEKGGEGGFFNDLKRELLLRKYSYKTVKGYLYYNRDFLNFTSKSPPKRGLSQIYRQSKAKR